jgi:hypothetical protein
MGNSFPQAGIFCLLKLFGILKTNSLKIKKKKKKKKTFYFHHYKTSNESLPNLHFK